MTQFIDTVVYVDVDASTAKDAALGKMAELLAPDHSLDATELHAGFVAREGESSTGFGNGVAIPHAKVKGLTQPFVGTVTFTTPVEWDALDGQPVDIAIGLIMPADDPDQVHLRVLSKLARKLMDDDFIAELKGAQHDQDRLNQVLQSVLTA
jgi:mannitol/fructose-specific phosphotransferase system IIA component (Ntr-type)